MGVRQELGHVHMQKGRELVDFFNRMEEQQVSHYMQAIMQNLIDADSEDDEDETLKLNLAMYGLITILLETQYA